DLSSRLGVKRGAKLISKTTRPSPSTIITPPKAAIAAPNAKKDEIHRRRNPFNDMLRRGGGVENETDTASPSAGHVPRDGAPLSLTSEETVDARLGSRVAELERALILAKGEQDALKEELETAREQGQAKEYTIETLRHQLAETRQNIEVASSCISNEHGRDKGPADHSEEELVGQNYELRYKILQLQEQLSTQDANYREIVEQNTSVHGESEWNELRSRLHTTEKESQERLQQLLSLKSSISSLTRIDSQITDNELVVSFSQLANCVREWAIVSSSLMLLFQEPLMVGIPRTGSLAAFQQTAEMLRDTVTGAQYRDFRRATIRALESCEASRTIEKEKQGLLHQMAEEIRHLLFTLTSVSLTAAAQSALFGILSNTADLQHTLALQKATYQVLFFRRQVSEKIDFEEEKMDSVNDLDNATDEDGDTLTERKFLFCVFPCLEKHGDEWGEHPETSNVLLKARVCCGVG
ncbi:hypothetical protein BKA66DRAFT_412490, partial [Pyrenochaeta sp. MPI-SDFR-AT-0127]